jgi:hypothetical protein
MKVKALVGFSGPALSMAKGATAEITDEVVLQDLLHAGYVEAVEPVKAVKAAETKKEVPKNEGKRDRKKRSS